jgi:hypothetical protein
VNIVVMCIAYHSLEWMSLNSIFGTDRVPSPVNPERTNVVILGFTEFLHKIIRANARNTCLPKGLACLEALTCRKALACLTVRLSARPHIRNGSEVPYKYDVYEVRKATVVVVGPVAPWFG